MTLIIGEGMSGGAIGIAAAFVASFCPRAQKSGGPVDILVNNGDEQHTVTVTPCRETPLGWSETSWQDSAPVRNALDTRPR